MKASQSNLQPLIDGQLQYVVPLFQRPYSWEKKQWQTLWDDIESLCEQDDGKQHFIGSIVTMQTESVPEGIPKFLLIDGQQRLTTIFIFLTALRDFAQSSQQSERHANEINDLFLINRYKEGNDQYKLLPTQVDRESFISMLDREQVLPEQSITRAYQFFQTRLRRSNISVQTLKRVITTKLSVVSIVLDRDDNPYLVFESLNAKGRPLAQSDLIRNFFFMRIHPDDQEKVYRQYWQPMEDRMGSMLTEYIRHYLTSSGEIIKESDVYFTLKDRINSLDVLESLEKLSQWSVYYQRFRAPENEPDSVIRAMLSRLKQLEITTIYPFLLPCYVDYVEGRLSHDDLVSVFEVIENYLLRRFVCNIPSSGFNKVAPVVYEQARREQDTGCTFVDAVRLVLSKRDYPKDPQFHQNLINTPLYGSGDRKPKTRLLLHLLERSFGHKETVVLESLTIEHIMPQTLTSWWKQHLGENAETTHDIYLHTLGNLTLTGYNSELSNQSFPEKKRLLLESHVELNDYFQDIQVWNEDAIQLRADVLAKRLMQLLPYFGEATATNITEAESVTGRYPIGVRILGQTYSVASWRDVFKTTADALFRLDPDALAFLVDKYPAFLSRDPRRFPRNFQMENGIFLQVNLNANAIYSICKRLVSDIGLSEVDWQVETS